MYLLRQQPTNSIFQAVRETTSKLCTYLWMQIYKSGYIVLSILPHM